MNSLKYDYPQKFLNAHDTPCISLYQPTHRTYPDREQDVIRFKNLVKVLEKSLTQKYASRETEMMLEPFYQLMNDEDFWNHLEEGLAILATLSSFNVYTLPRAVGELVLVADTFHIKPLIRIMQSSGHYQILGISRARVTLYEGNRDGIEEIALSEDVPNTIEKALGYELTEPHLTVATYGKGTEGPAMHHGHGGRKDDAHLDAERFFRRVDEAILKYHSREAKLPLLLAALPEYHHVYHKVSQNPYLLPDGIKLNPDNASLEELKQQAWLRIEPYIQKRLDALINKFSEADAKALGSTNLNHIAEAAIAGRISTLLIEEERRVPGRIDHTSGQVKLDELLDPETDDLLDDLGELVLRKHGEVLVIPSDKMPSDTGIAAIYRF